MSKVSKRLQTLLFVIVLALLAQKTAEAQLQQITTTTVDLGVANTAAVLRRPVSDVLGRSHVGLFIMHPYAGYTTFQGCNDLAARGFTTLCANGPFNGNQFGYYGYEQHAPTIAAGINFLR